MPVRFCFISIQPSNWAPDFSARPAASSLCSPLPARPCASVPGSKIFTFPPPVFSLPRDRRPPLFAPHSPLTLVPPFRGAKSSHSRHRFSPKPFENGLKLGAKETEEQGFAVVRAPSLRHPAAQAQRAHNLTLPTARRRLSPRMRKKHRATQLLLGAFLSSFSIIPIPLLPPAQS